ncbi:hypothetical protein [Streptomyces sp. NBC_00344]|uniref:hypothetical protein n=1 Tax=Streptomyces sp. NBC_00344 TaxID=2975720 RepID=UPI002E1D4835
MQRRNPQAMVGRTSAAFRRHSTGKVPLGALMGGPVAAGRGLDTPVLLTACLFLAAVASLVRQIN